jgi:Cys-rich protein (TIGR01571 family)
MSGYQRIPEDNNNSNNYPGNVASPPPAYPQIDYARNVASPVNPQQYQQPLLQHQSSQPQQYQQQQQPQQYQQQQQQQQPQYQPQHPQYPAQAVQPSPYTQHTGTYAVPPQDGSYQQYQAPVVDGQPMYNAYGYPTYPSTVAVGYVQPTGVLQPGVPGHIVRGNWSDSVFDCFTHVSSCLLTCFFPCIRWAQTVKRANLMSFWGALFLYSIPALAAFCISVYFSTLTGDGYNVTFDNDYYYGQYSSLIVPLYVVLVISNIFVVVLGAVFRSKLREKYQIPGSGCEDCFWHFCCSCCAIAQEARHVDRDLGLAI